MYCVAGALLLIGTSITCHASPPDPKVLLRHSLEKYPSAICNDGTPAVYYRQSTEPTSGQNVVIYLEGGGACVSKEDCLNRCNVTDPALCTASTDETKIIWDGTKMWSQDPKENPPFHSHYKVYMPYCSSDVYSGTHNASDETGGFTFHGKFIVAAMIEDMMDSLLVNASQVVLTGLSAGGFGVANNCDQVAEMVEAKNSKVDMRCIMDSGDFIPYWIHDEGCDPLQNAAFTADFWGSVPDESCLNETNSNVNCSVFSQYFPHISTPFMVLDSEWDTNIPGQICMTEPVAIDSDRWKEWRLAMVELAKSVIELKPGSGMYLNNCPWHGCLDKDDGWLEMPVNMMDGNDTEVMAHVIFNWLNDQPPYQAIDHPDVINPMCNHQSTTQHPSTTTTSKSSELLGSFSLVFVFSLYLFLSGN